MYGKNTNYETKMTKSEQKTYKADHLIIPFKNDEEELYSNAGYTFSLLSNQHGQLVIKRRGKPQKTIRFVLSKAEYININSKYG